MSTTAQVIPIRPPTFNALIQQTKAAWDRADEKRADADDWAVRTGKLLVELKTQVKKDKGRWMTALKKLGRSPRRAQELMQLASGDVTVEDQRERVREAMKTSRKKKRVTLRASELPDDDDAEPGDGPREFWQRSLANLCGDVLARRALWTRLYPGWKKFDCPSHVQTLVREAATEFAALAATVAKMSDRE